jgi:hypothetical protein
MAITGSGQVSLSDIQTEFGGSNPIGLGEYYDKGNAPSSGEIQLAADFYGTSAYGGITWSTDDDTPASLSFGIKFGIIGAQGIVDCNDKNASGYPSTYEHNGSSWSTTGDCAGTHGVGCGGGTQGAGVIASGWDDVGGDESNVTEEYNGSTWSTGGNMVSGSAYSTGGGTLQTAQLITGGASYGPTVRDLSMTQTYNGTSWSNESVSSDGRGSSYSGESGGNGLDAFFSASGQLDAGANTNTQLFNQSGGSWTSKAAANSAKTYGSSSSDGTRVYRVGGSSVVDTVESWVENAWTSENALPTACRGNGLGTGGAESAGGASSVAGLVPSLGAKYYISALA